MHSGVTSAERYDEAGVNPVEVDGTGRFAALDVSCHSGVYSVRIGRPP